MIFEPTPHDFAFDPTYGCSVSDLESLRYDDPHPEDFAEFWKDVHADALEVPLDLRVEESTALADGVRCRRVNYRVWPDYTVGAWVLDVPDAPAPPRLGVVAGHGYGGREAPDPGFAAPDRIVILTVAPGFHISPDPRVPHNCAAEHVVHGIASRERYLLASCAATIWRGVDVLTELTDDSLTRFHYHGWSFGGGMGALSVPWEPRFQSAELGHVTFANHPFRLRHECVGSGAAVRQYWLRDPSIEETLRYYDAAFSVRFLTIPTLFGCSCFDPAVPPPGQWSAVHNHPGPKAVTAFPVGHFDYHHPRTAEAEARHQRNLADLIPDVRI